MNEDNSLLVRFKRPKRPFRRESGFWVSRILMAALLLVLAAGSMSVRSAPGEGACFSIRLPLAPDTR